MLKLTEKQLKRILWDDEEGFEIVYQSDWEQNHKHQTCEVVFEHNGKHYMFHPSRYGTYWDGYEYEIYDTDVWEVELKPITIEKWVAVDKATTVSEDGEQIEVVWDREKNELVLDKGE